MYLQGYAEGFADFLVDKITYTCSQLGVKLLWLEMPRAIQLSRNSLTVTPEKVDRILANMNLATWALDPYPLIM